MAAITQHNQQHPHGYFADPDTGLPVTGPVVHAEWMTLDRDMVLDVPVVFVDPLLRIHRVPAGERINGLSVPRMFWRFCWPYEPLTRDASVVHDWLCSIGHDWDDAAWVFWCAMRCRGVKPFQAWVRWAAVRFIGGCFQWRHRA